MDDSPATAKLHQEGRLSQRCPGCGLVEAAGGYCTRCLTKTGPADYFVKATGRHAQTAAPSHSAPQGSRNRPSVVEGSPASPVPAAALTLGLT